MTIHFTPQDLHTLDAEPRVHDLRLAEALGFSRQRDIRQIIERNLEELGQHGSLAVQRRKSRGQEFTEYWLNEAQALLICMFSKTANAAEVRRALIEVFMAWRHSRLEAPEELQIAAQPCLEAIPAMPIDFSGEFSPEAATTVNAKIALLTKIEKLFGKPAACTAYHHLGLPPVKVIALPESAPDTTEALHILQQILDYEPPRLDGISIRSLATSAMDGDADANKILEGFGLRAFPDRDCFFVANRCPAYQEMVNFIPETLAFQMRRLKGAHGSKQENNQRLDGIMVRGTFLPASYLDPDYAHAVA